MLDDLGIIFAEMVPETPVAYILRRAVARDDGGVKDIMLHIRSDYSSSFDTIRDTYNDSLVAVNP
jgi:hypothetical protein